MEVGRRGWASWVRWPRVTQARDVACIVCAYLLILDELACLAGDAEVAGQCRRGCRAGPSPTALGPAATEAGGGAARSAGRVE